MKMVLCVVLAVMAAWGQSVFTGTATLTGAAKFGRPVIPDAYFGMHINKASTPWPGSLTIGLERSTSSQVDWGNLETTTVPGTPTFNWTALDNLLSRAPAQVDILYEFLKIPAVYATNPNDTTCSFYPGACSPPNDLNADGSGTNQHFKDFMTALLNHVYDGTHAVGSRIKYYEVWNEYNVPGFWDTGGDNVQLYRQMIRMAEDVRCTIKG